MISMSLGNDMMSVAPTVCAILGLRPPRSSETEPLLEVVESMGPSGRLAVVVIDALGVSTWTNAKAETPFLNALANRRLLRLRSVMPTVTPVNFATMLTGASPGIHTIRDRTEPLGLETIFDVLRENGGISATAARAKSSLGILISPHADEPGIAESNTDDEVKDIALEMMGRGVALLWVQLLGHGGGALDVGEEDGDHATFLAHLAPRGQQLLGELRWRQALDGFVKPFDLAQGKRRDDRLLPHLNRRCTDLCATNVAKHRPRGQLPPAFGANQRQRRATLQTELGDFTVFGIAFRTLHLSLPITKLIVP